MTSVIEDLLDVPRQAAPLDRSSLLRLVGINAD